MADDFATSPQTVAKQDDNTLPPSDSIVPKYDVRTGSIPRSLEGYIAIVAPIHDGEEHCRAFIPSNPNPFLLVIANDVDRKVCDIHHPSFACGASVRVHLSWTPGLPRPSVGLHTLAGPALVVADRDTFTFGPNGTPYCSSESLRIVTLSQVRKFESPLDAVPNLRQHRHYHRTWNAQHPLQGGVWAELPRRTFVEGSVALPPSVVSNTADAASKAWPALAKIVRDTDEGKVKDCKEDIDTLLVFAGLFSAVMTAFLIESYKGLQEDTGAISVQLLAEIAAQGRSSRLQERSPPAVLVTTASGPFSPPASAVRVNVLWFASLSFSLITASFAMLVKQWLREYLADEQSRAQARLRIRHFRLPGIVNWKVFEIAALLPVLLQLSLGLFLIGLCFFAWSVHPTVGQTCVPLVTMWGLCIVFSSLAPMWSARCPYKIPFLKNPLGYIRRPLRTTVLDAQYAIQVLYQRLRRSSSSSETALVRWPARPSRHMDDESTEETWAASHRDYDVDILTALDIDFQDDDLLHGPILDAAWGVYDSYDYLIDFLMDAIRRRHPSHDLSPNNLPTDLQAISSGLWDIAIGTSLDVLRRCTSEGALGLVMLSSSAMRIALMLVLSRTSPEYWARIKSQVCEVLSPMFAEETSVLALRACSALAQADGFGRSDGGAGSVLWDYLNKLTDVFLVVGGERAFRAAEQVIGRRVREEYVTTFSRIREVVLCDFRLSKIRESPWEGSLTAEDLGCVRIMVVRIVNAAMEQQASDDSWAPWLTEALTFVVESYTMDKYRTYEWPLGEVWSTSPTPGDPIMLLSMRRYRSALETLRCLAQIELRDWSAYHIRLYMHSIYSTNSGAQAALTNFQRVVIQHTQLDARAAPCPFRLCHIALRFVRLPHAVSHLTLWRALLLDLSPLLRSSSCACHDHLALAELCMHLVHALECHNIQFRRDAFVIPVERSGTREPEYFAPGNEALYRAWLRQFDETASLFPDDLIDSLSGVIGKEGLWYRERRLRDIRRSASHDVTLPFDERHDRGAEEELQGGDTIDLPQTVNYYRDIWGNILVPRR